MVGDRQNLERDAGLRFGSRKNILIRNWGEVWGELFENFERFITPGRAGGETD